MTKLIAMARPSLISRKDINKGQVIVNAEANCDDLTIVNHLV